MFNKVKGGRMDLKYFLLISVLVAVPAVHGMGRATKQQVMDYLWSIWGSKTISGQHNRQPMCDPTETTRKVQNITGKTPGLWGNDFMFGKAETDCRQKMINEAKQQWKDGSLVALMINVCPPTRDENCAWDSGDRPVQSKLSNQQWTSLLTDGADLNRKWKQRLDIYASFLKQLQDAGIVVIFRPFQELNWDGFWWGGRGKQTASLYQLTHNYLTRNKGLNNLIWVWCVTDEAPMGGELNDLFPGLDYVDMAALDVYDRNHPQARVEHYNRLQELTQNGRLLALGETGKIPSPATLEQQPKWVYFLEWVEHLTENNSEDEIRATYNSDRTLERGELHTWW